jgi:PAS domain S-box-containing protein
MGYEKEEIYGINPFDFVIFDPGTSAAIEVEKLYRDGHITLEVGIKTRDGSCIPVEVNIHTYVSKGKQIIQTIARDITERKLAERKLADNLKFLQILIDTIPVPVFYKNTQGTYIGCNNAFEKYLGKSREQIIGKTVYDINPVELADIFHQSDMSLLRSGSMQTYETEVMHADGSAHDNIFYKAPFYNPDGTLGGLIGTMLDITERKHIEERLRGSLQEKEVLLKEVHHRVKNNMQIISSLLNLQLSDVDQEPVRQILEESQNRIRSIALVHERMYKSSDLSRIDFSEYLKSMCNQLLLTYLSTTERVKITVDGTSIHLGVDQAVPCGLILNELISNSLKHAFPGSRPGTVKIHLNDKDHCTITIEDDGVGLPENFGMDSAQSMGMQLVSALVEQLEGTITFDRTPGTQFTITFPAK